MKSITEISKEIYPQDFDLDKAKEKGIGNKNDYEEVQKNYLIYFSMYLDSLYDFSAIDDQLSDEGFQPVKQKNYYFNRSELNSEYIYLRNNVHCENLMKEQIDFLRKKVQGSLKEEGIALAKETYVEVLSARSDFFEADFKLSYIGGTALRNMVPNTALLFYLQFDDIKKNDETYLEEDRKEQEKLETLSNDIVQELESELDVEVYIFNSGSHLLN